MEVFSHFEILDLQGNRVVEGHKVKLFFLYFIGDIIKHLIFTLPLSFCMLDIYLLFNTIFSLYAIRVFVQASFCLEDNDCHGVEEKYKCENFGDQGITAGCKDIYYYNIDCQWIDITDLNPGTYIFKMAINPEYKIPEMTFENNAALCNLHYNEV